MTGGQRAVLLIAAGLSIGMAAQVSEYRWVWAILALMSVAIFAIRTRQ